MLILEKQSINFNAQERLKLIMKPYVINYVLLTGKKYID